MTTYIQSALSTNSDHASLIQLIIKHFDRQFINPSLF